MRNRKPSDVKRACCNFNAHFDRAMAATVMIRVADMLLCFLNSEFSEPSPAWLSDLRHGDRK
jgi:hypothetical protein